jgi:prepilin-type N-terminal cleavage/methylation domain-containing protein/prepilin-type processing-associated H-X9-DG protein
MPNVQQFSRRRNIGRRSGFTLVEVLAVIAIILVVVGLLSSSLNQTRARALRMTCLNNMKQLQVAWYVYSTENDDYIVLNKTAPVSSGTSIAALASTTNSWVAGNPKLDKNAENVTKGKLYEYVRQPDVYRCPMDSSTTRFGTMRARSYSVNAYLGGDDDDLDPRVKMKVGEIINPPPDKVFVFIEEHEDSIWNGGFMVLPQERFSKTTGAWSSTPSDRHMQGCNLTFADGHLEYWKWLSPKKPERGNQLINNIKELKDLRRLQESVPKP